MNDRTKRLIQLFFASFSIFIYEILILRVFSVLFEQELLFVMISGAVLGLGAGGILYKPVQERESLVFIFFGLSYPFSLAAVISFFSYLGIGGTVLVSLLPFGFGGMILASIYRRYPEQSGLFYSFDLAGGVAGCLGSLLLVQQFGVLNTILLTGVLGTVPYLYYQTGETRPVRSWGPLLTAAIFFLVHLGYPYLAIGPGHLKKTSTPLGKMLNYPRVKARWLASSWDVYSRCDLISASKKQNKKSIFINTGAEAIMLQDDGAEEMHKNYDESVLYFPYKFGPNEKVLVLGAGGGQDVMMALLGGAKGVTAVEINEGVVDFTRQQGDYNGHIYDRPEVDVVIEDGRTYLMRNFELYDKIVLNLASTYAFSDLAALAQMENYLYTKEAFALYFSHLKDGGELVIFINFPQLAEKFLHTGYDYFLSQGISAKDAASYMLALAPADWSYMLFFRNRPYQTQTVDSIKEEAENTGIRLLALPYYHVDYSQSTLAELITTDFNAIAAGARIPAYFRARSPYRLAPATDNKPFFLEVVLNQRFMLIKFLGIIILGTIFLLAWYWIWDQKNHPGPDSKNSGILYCIYFLLTGAGFMAVEMGLIKRFSFYFGYPHLTLAVTISSLLIGAGVGSYFSQRFLDLQNTRWRIYLLVVLPLFLLVTQLSLTSFIGKTISYSISQRVLLYFVYTAPIAFLMGLFFPTGLRISSTHRPLDIPWFYGLNGVASVAGSVLAVVVAMGRGIESLFFLAAAIYAAAAFLIIIFTNTSIFNQ